MKGSSWHIADDGRALGAPPASTVSLAFVLSSVRRLWYLWLAFALVGVFAAAGWLLVVPERSVGTVTLLLAHDPGTDPETAMATDISLLRTRIVAQELSDRLSLDAPVQDLQESILAQPTTSSVLQVDITGADAGRRGLAGSHPGRDLPGLPRGTAPAAERRDHRRASAAHRGAAVPGRRAQRAVRRHHGARWGRQRRAGRGHPDVQGPAARPDRRAGERHRGRLPGGLRDRRGQPGARPGVPGAPGPVAPRGARPGLRAGRRPGSRARTGPDLLRDDRPAAHVAPTSRRRWACR